MVAEICAKVPHRLLFIKCNTCFNRSTHRICGCSNFSRNYLDLRNTREYNHLRYRAFTIVPFGNYTILSATLKVLETSLEAILWKTFQLFRHIPTDISNITKAMPLLMPISIEGTGHNQVQPGQESEGDVPVMSQCSLFKILHKTDRCVGALFWRRNQLLILHVSGHFLLTPSLMRRRMPMYISLLILPIPLQFTNYFL